MGEQLTDHTGDAALDGRVVADHEHTQATPAVGLAGRLLPHHLGMDEPVDRVDDGRRVGVERLVFGMPHLVQRLGEMGAVIAHTDDVHLLELLEQL